MIGRLRVPVVSFGGQYNHLIVRRMAELGVETELVPADVPPGEVDADALVMGGGPQSVPADLPRMGFAADYVLSGLPVLGICLSHHLVAHVLGGRVGPAARPEFGGVEIRVIRDSVLFQGLPERFIAWESHNDEVLEHPPGAEVTASSESCEVQALEAVDRGIFGVQFHPEVSHTRFGREVLANFLRTARR